LLGFFILFFNFVLEGIIELSNGGRKKRQSKRKKGKSWGILFVVVIILG